MEWFKFKRVWVQNGTFRLLTLPWGGFLKIQIWGGIYLSISLTFQFYLRLKFAKKKSVNGLSAPGRGLGGFQVQSWSISKSVAGNRCLLPVVSKCLLPADGRLCQQMWQLAQVWILKLQRRGKGKRFHFMRWLLFLLDTLWASNQREPKEDHSCKSLCNEWLVYWMVSEDPYSLMSSAFGHCPNTIRLPPRT